jgi:hypothetical protein
MESATQPQHDWPYPESLDAMNADPEHHTLLFENDHVRVIDTKIPAGGRTNIHTHKWPALLQVITAGDFIRFDPSGKILFDSRSNPHHDPIVWGEPLPPHFLENVGGTDIHILGVEIKHP